MIYAASITTKRLNVFVFRIIISETCILPRRLYVAYHKELDQPEHVVTATVSEQVNDFPPYLDWIETNSRCRRKGFATELVKAIEADMGQEIAADGATDEGEAFCDALSANA